MYFTGFADEASKSIEGQIEVTKALGWKFIEARQIDGTNLHDVSEEVFEDVCCKLADAGIGVNCFGSCVANWGWEPMDDDHFEQTKKQLERAIVRMKKLNCTMLRGMSFKAQWERPAWDPEVEKHVFSKVNTLVKMCQDAGVEYLHENCNNYGGQSWKHTLKLLENVPGLKLIFDTGNPVLNFDRSEGDALEKMQDSFVFYSNVKDFIRYVHIKDGVCTEKKIGFSSARYTFAGEGDGKVRQIVGDLLKNGYDGGFSMEPHMGYVFHDTENGNAEDQRKEIYIEYGRRFEKLVEELSPVK